MKRFFLGLSLLLGACGVDPIDIKAPEGVRKISSLEEDSSFSLQLKAMEKKTMNMMGSIIVWQDREENSELVAEVIGLSSAMKKVMSETVTPAKEKLALKQEKSDLEKAVIKEESDHLLNFIEEFNRDELLASYQNELPDAVRYTQEFELFCDAHYIDFATSPLVIKESFTDRPTPHPACERYYNDREYFVSDNCSVSSEPKNYFSCFWSTDFLKKSHIQLREKKNGPAYTQENLDSQDFRDRWASEDWNSFFPKKKTAMMKGILRFSNKSKLFFVFASSGKGPDKNKDLALSPFLDESSEFEFQFPKYVFSMNDFLFNMTLLEESEKASYYKLEKDMEKKFLEFTQKNETVFPTPYELFDSSESKAGKELPQVKKALEKKKNKIEELSQKLVAKKKALDTLFLKNLLAESYWQNIGIHLTETDSGGTQISWALNPTSDKFLRCSLDSKGNSAPAEGDLLTGCSFNRKEGTLSFKAKGADAARIGWSVYEKIRVLEDETVDETGNTSPTGSFNFIERGKLEELEIHFNLNYVLYGGTLPLFTGDVKLMKGEELVYQGSVMVYQASVLNPEAAS